MDVSLLASGSTGNSIFIQEGTTRVLVDAGLTGKEIEKRLRLIEVDISSLQAIVVSHEHADHIRGVGVLARRLKLPVWITQGTLNASNSIFQGPEQIQVFENDKRFQIGDIAFQPFPLSHDAADPVNFVIFGDGSQVGIATDMGIVTQLVYHWLRDSDFVIIEANYDRDLLMQGSYPWDLKRRISSSHGHLSNFRASEVLSRLAEEGLKKAVLAHLSRENNRPDLAERVCNERLEAQGITDFFLCVAEPDRPTDIFVI